MSQLMDIQVDDPVEVEGKDCPPPLSCWEDAVVAGYMPAKVKQLLEREGIQKPSAIQRYAVPIIAHKNRFFDIIAMASTGSGKTFAFVIPIVSSMVIQGVMPRPFFPGQMAQGQPIALALAPTRELAIQTQKEVSCLIAHTDLHCIAMYGGEALNAQVRQLQERQVDIISATPGRLLDAVDHGKLSFMFVQTVVLDEADQMISLGLVDTVSQLLTGRDLPEKENRQTLLFSATFPPKIQELCKSIIRPEPHSVTIRIGKYNQDQGGSTKNITQIVRKVPEGMLRMKQLFQDLQDHWWNGGNPIGQVIIFTNTRAASFTVAQQLTAHMGVTVCHLHGKLSMEERFEVFEAFRKREFQVLTATNVASRGLDFPDIKAVIQYDLANDVETYTHRIGRTGRGGQTGVAISYMDTKEVEIAGPLMEFLQLNEQEIPPFLQPMRDRYQRAMTAKSERNLVIREKILEEEAREKERQEREAEREAKQQKEPANGGSQGRKQSNRRDRSASRRRETRDRDDRGRGRDTGRRDDRRDDPRDRRRDSRRRR